MISGLEVLYISSCLKTIINICFFMAKNTMSKRVESHMANICAGLLCHLSKLLEKLKLMIMC